MMALFIDTRALVKLLVIEPGSIAVEQAVSADRNVFISAVTPLELVSAIRRKNRDGSLTDGEMVDVMADFDGAFLARAQIIRFGDEVSHRARSFLERNAGLRTCWMPSSSPAAGKCLEPRS